MSQTPAPRRRPASGFTVFAASMLILVGVWNVLEGLAAIIKKEFFVVTANYLFKFDVTAWGWINLVLGILLILAGGGIFAGAVWARTVGIIVAGLAAIASFMWLPYYPVWAILIIAVCVLSIWALTARGSDITSRD
jgi:hypothetical protein